MMPNLGLPEKESTGRYPAYAWPGGYPMYYLFADGEACCPSCANGDNGSEAGPDAEERDWRLVGAAVNWEDPDLACAHCGTVLEVAYP